MKGKGFVILIIVALLVWLLWSRKTQAKSDASPAADKTVVSPIGKQLADLSKPVVASVQSAVQTVQRALDGFKPTIWPIIKPTISSPPPLDPAAEKARLDALRAEAALMAGYYNGSQWGSTPPPYTPSPGDPNETDRTGPDGEQYAIYDFSPYYDTPLSAARIDEIVAEAQQDWAAAMDTSGVYTVDPSGALTEQAAPEISINEAQATDSQASQELVEAVVGLAEAGAPGVSIDSGWSGYDDWGWWD